MPDEATFADWLRSLVDKAIRDGKHELRDATTDGLPENEAGFTLTLLDGTVFVITATKIKEGE